MCVLIRRKPIICAEGSEELGLYKYKYCHDGWILNVKIKIFTDLTCDEFDDFCEGKYNMEQIRRFEMTGIF